MPALRLILLTLAACSSFAVAACGGDTQEKNDYVGAVNEVTTTLNAGLTTISSEAATVNSPEQAQGVFTDFATQLDTAAADISQITPPGDVAELHDQLVGDIQTLSAEATAAADEIKTGGAASVAGVATGFITQADTLSAEIDSTISEINSKLRG
jgi:hypothetical protein